MAVATDLMYFRYGDYVHPKGEVNLVNTETVALKNERNQTWAKKVIMHIQGEIIYDPAYTAPWRAQGYAPGALVTNPQHQFSFRVNQLENAYSENNKSAALFTSDDISTPHILDMTRTDRIASGVQVDYRSFPRAGPDEFATVRTFYIRLSAIFFDEDSQIQSFREHVSIVGTGNPEWRWAKAWTPNGQPAHFQQVVNPQTTVKIFQTGSIVALSTWAPPQARIRHLEAYEHQDRRVIIQGAPRWQGVAFSHYMTSWRYVYETPPGGTANPNLYNRTA